MTYNERERAETFNLRLPADLMATIRQCAGDNQRSINAEIIWRLRRSLEGYRQ